MLSHGFKWSHADHFLHKGNVDGNPVILVIHVMIFISGKQKNYLNALKDQLKSAFNMNALQPQHKKFLKGQHE